MIDQQFINQVEVLDYLQHCKSIVPGFRKAYAFFYHPIYKEIQSVVISQESKSIKRLSSSSKELSDSIYKLRTSKLELQWVDESDIPFEQLSKSTNIQKKVFDELKHYILLLKTPNQWDGNQDLIYIFFKPDASNFGLKKLDSKLSTEQKNIIASLMQRSFAAFHTQRNQFQNENNQLREDYKLMGEQLKEMQIQKKVQKQNHHKKLAQYITYLMETEVNKLNLHLQLTQEAQLYIQNYDGPIEHIVKAVNKTVLMAYRVLGSIEGGILRIEEYFLKPHFAAEQHIASHSSIESIADSRYARTIQIMNRMENAARKVQAEGRTLSGSNVGQAMDSPISAPAISDAIKKHRKKIQSLCSEYPDEWILIRKSFKPVINALSA